MKQRISKIVKDTFKDWLGLTRPVSDNDTMYGSGADELDMVELVMAFEDDLVIEIDDAIAETFGTMKVKDIVEVLYQIKTREPYQTTTNQPVKDTTMSSKKAERTFVVRGYDAMNELFDNPVGVIEDKSTFKEVVANTQAEAIICMLTDDVIGTMTPLNLINFADFTLVGQDDFIDSGGAKDVLQIIDLKITLGLTDKLEVRATKSALREVIKRWAEKSRSKGRRGFRASAIKTPVFEYAVDETYVRVQVILSNAVLYSDSNGDVAPNSYVSMVDDLALLRKELSRQLAWKFKALNFSHNVFGKGEVL